MRKFIVIAGNNQGVIKRALIKRGNWEDVSPLPSWLSFTGYRRKR